jgi:hypothetical protein
VRQDPVRDEAERLVATAVAAISLAARSIPSAGPRAFATGSEECCVCPLCRLIAAMREPSPELTEKIATGAGDLATAVTGVLRLFSRGGHDEPEAPTEAPQDDYWQALRQQAADAARGAARAAGGNGHEDAWHVATRTEPGPPPVKKAVVKKVAKKAAAKTAVAKKAPPPSPEPPPPAPPVKKVAKKAVARKVPPGAGTEHN